MWFGSSEWLFDLLRDAVASHRADEGVLRFNQADESPVPRARARAYLKQIVRETGLLFGTPAQPSTALPNAKTAEDQLLLAVVGTYARIALDIASLMKAPEGPRLEQLLLLLAVLVGDRRVVQQLLSALAQRPVAPIKDSCWRRVEWRLKKRGTSVSGDPVYRLILHNASVYADAQAFGRLAIDFFSRGSLRIAAAERRLAFAARQKALLAEVLVGLACVERQPNFAAQRAILRQTQELALSWKQRMRLNGALKSFFDTPPQIASLAGQVRSGGLRRFVLEQTILGSLVDGSWLARDVAFIRSLAENLGVSTEELGGIEIEMAEFFASHRSILDVFRVSAGAGAMGEELVQSMQRALEKNFHRLMREVRGTGELSVLLTRAARGQKLSAQERRKMRTQLIDVAKAVPALAIFAAPGGILLLIALAKVLPFNILPSAFQDESEEDLVPRSTRRADALAERQAGGDPRSP